MNYIDFIKKLALGIIGVSTIMGVFTACEEEFYKDEQYRKEILIVSSDDNIFGQEVTFGGDAICYLSIYASGTKSIENEVTVELAKDGTILREYNQIQYGESYDKYALELPESRYTIDDWTATLYPSEDTPYTLFPIHVDIDDLSPEEKYFIPLKIASVSDYMISSEKRNVLLRIYMKNDYATTKSDTYFQMNGTSQTIANENGGATGNVTAINATKLVVPIGEQTIRILPGYTSTTDGSELRLQGIAVTVHPDEWVDVDVLGDDGLPTGQYVKRQKVTMASWYTEQESIDVRNIDDTPSYYDPDKNEFTLYYRYRYSTSQWYEMSEVLSSLDIENEN